MDKYKRFKIYVDGQIFSNLYLVKCDDKKLVLYKKETNMQLKLQCEDVWEANLAEVEAVDHGKRMHQ